MTSSRIHLPDDWFPLGIPENVSIGRDVYLDSSYGFAAFHSREQPGLVLGDGCGVYDRAAMVVGPRGRVTVGAFSELNGTYVICEERVDIGAHCLLAWGVTVTDSWVSGLLEPGVSAQEALLLRREALRRAAHSPLRPPSWASTPRPVTIEDSVWIGFDSVVLPGVTLGRGAVVGSRSVVRESVPPYAVVVGDPAHIVRKLEPTDTPEARAEALQTRVR